MAGTRPWESYKCVRTLGTPGLRRQRPSSLVGRFRPEMGLKQPQHRPKDREKGQAKLLAPVLETADQGLIQKDAPGRSFDIGQNPLIEFYWILFVVPFYTLCDVGMIVFHGIFPLTHGSRSVRVANPP